MTVLVYVNTSKQVGDTDHVADHVSVSISFRKMNRNSMRCFAFYRRSNPCAPGPSSAR
jgi:hypothetical protein